MDTIMSAKEFARWHFGCDEPTSTQMNSITQQCRDGTIRHAEKVGRTWYVNCTRSFPRLFPPEERREAASLDDMLIGLGKLLKEVEDEARE